MSASFEEGALFVLGNLLLDLVIPVEDDYLAKYGLQPDSIQTAEPKHAEIYTEIMNRPDVTVCPGGSALNTVRMAQRLLNNPSNYIVLVGAVGSDDTGRLLTSTVAKEGIKMVAQVVEDCPTGKCACLLTGGGSARTMVTELGAALKFNHERFLQDEGGAMGWLGKAKCVYISGYFLKVSPATVMEVARQAKSKQIPILLNLNAVWITTLCKNELLNVLPYTDILIGNESEIVSFGEQLGLGASDRQPDILTIAKRLSFLKSKDNPSSNHLIVIVTRGERPVILAENGAITEYPIAAIPKEAIVDSTGAGDAFVGGKYIGDCMAQGIWAASEELKGYGFVLPSSNALQ